MYKVLLAAAALSVVACGPRVDSSAGQAASSTSARSQDSSFSALQQRGESAMGVNQYTSQHVFEPLPDGGRIVLQRKESDSAGAATIRAHMRSIAASFSKGDFAVPGFVHGMSAVPGTDVMKRLSTEISYVATELPRGGQVRISSGNPGAVAAVHEFLAFQRMDHRTEMH
ncbi:MAG: hypothetical protein ABR585_03240 [Gemmatimonadaceae bacterium]